MMNKHQGKFGQYPYTWEETRALIAPSPEHVERVESWLKSYELVEPMEKLSDGSMIRVVVSVATANRMLHANYQPYLHVNNQTVVCASLKLISSI